jgi:CO/xanthine dehydrogenase Mo-binding subunit
MFVIIGWVVVLVCVFGGYALAAAWGKKNEGAIHRLVSILWAILTLVTGLLLLFKIGAGVLTLTILLAAYFAAQGIVTIRVPHTEMGQGAMTSVAQLVAEELNVPWKDVRAVLADANRHVTQGNVYNDMSTGGSNLVRNRHPHLMQAGASARERLKEAAAKAWGVDRSQVKAEQGILTAGTNRGTYGAFATAAAQVTLAEEPKIKKYGDWWLLGKDVPRMDVAPKVDGSAIYPVDVRVPGMVYAAVKASPVTCCSPTSSTCSATFSNVRFSSSSP